MKIIVIKKEKIQKNIQDVYTISKNLNYWSKWSPWFHSDNKMEVKINDNLHQPTYFWKSEYVGSGEMILTKSEIIENKSAKIEMDLKFFKPMSGTAKVEYSLNFIDSNTTEFNWKLDFDAPFFMIFFKSFMIAMMGRQMEVGLMMLKDLCEKNQILTESTHLGVVPCKSMTTFGFKRSCLINEIDLHMGNDFHRLMDLVKNKQLPEPDQYLSFTYDFNVRKGTCELAAAVGYLNNQNINSIEGAEIMHIPAHQTYSVRHQGEYKYLANAWSAAMSAQRVKKIKINKKIPLYEVYLNNPEQTSKENLLTQVFLPMKN